MNTQCRRVFQNGAVIGTVRDLWSDNLLITGHWVPASTKHHERLLKDLATDREADRGVHVTIEGEDGCFLVRALDDDEISLRRETARP